MFFCSFFFKQTSHTLLEPQEIELQATTQNKQATSLFFFFSLAHNMLRLTVLARLNSKPITQGYVAQFAPSPRSSRLSSVYRRAANAHRSPSLPFCAEVASSRLILDEGDEHTVVEEQQEKYNKWYSDVYQVDDLETTAASGPSNKALAGGDQRNMELTAEMEEKAVQQEALFWEASFSHLENVK